MLKRFTSNKSGWRVLVIDIMLTLDLSLYGPPADIAGGVKKTPPVPYGHPCGARVASQRCPILRRDTGNIPNNAVGLKALNPLHISLAASFNHHLYWR